MCSNCNFICFTPSVRSSSLRQRWNDIFSLLRIPHCWTSFCPCRQLFQVFSINFKKPPIYESTVASPQLPIIPGKRCTLWNRFVESLCCTPPSGDVTMRNLFYLVQCQACFFSFSFKQQLILREHSQTFPIDVSIRKSGLKACCWWWC